MIRRLLFGKGSEKSDSNSEQNDSASEQNEKTQVIEHIEEISEKAPEKAPPLGARGCFSFCLGPCRCSDSDSSDDIRVNRPVEDYELITKQPTRVPEAGVKRPAEDPADEPPTKIPKHGPENPAGDHGDEQPAHHPKTPAKLKRTKGHRFVLPSPSNSDSSDEEPARRKKELEGKAVWPPNYPKGKEITRPPNWRKGKQITGPRPSIDQQPEESNIRSEPIDIPGAKPREHVFQHPSDDETELEPTNARVEEFRKQGAEFQTWIDDPNAPGCRYRRSHKRWADILERPEDERSQQLPEDLLSTGSSMLRVPSFEIAGNMPPDMPQNDVYRRILYQRYGHGDDGWVWSTFQHKTALGVFIAENIVRTSGPYWSEIAQAQYQIDHPMDSLKYVFFVNVINHETFGYVELALFPRLGRIWGKEYNDILFYDHGTQEYQELLGTQLGRGVARLVLGAWDRGTRRIARIAVWRDYGSLQVRFDLEAL